jgi:hypothetical protein
MLTAISRYGARVFPDTNGVVARAKARGEFIRGPQISGAFAAGREGRSSRAYGRMAFCLSKRSTCRLDRDHLSY